MAFTAAQKEVFLKFLQQIDEEVSSRLPPIATAEFFGILVDYSVDDTQFEIKIAQLFFKMPDRLEELKDSIRNLSTIRKAILENGSNAEESRELTLNYFFERIDEYLECHDFILIEKESDIESAARLERKERRAKKLAMEKHLRLLQEERQNIFEIEKNDRIERREQKKEEEEWVRELRQKEFEDEAEERKKHREQIEQEIKLLQQQLQSQHETDVEERKIRKQQKEYELLEKQKQQENERLRQAEIRKRIKDEQENNLQIRQQMLQEEQEKQGNERLERRKANDKSRKLAIMEAQKKQAEERASHKGFLGFHAKSSK